MNSKSIQMNKLRIVILFIGLILCVSGFVGLKTLESRNIVRFEKTITTADEIQMKIEIFEPLTIKEAAPNSIPTVIMCHGFGVSKEFYSNHGIELAKRGYLAISMEMRGHGHTPGDFLNGNYTAWASGLNLSREMTEQFPDMRYIMSEVDAVFEYIKSRSEVNINKIGVIGHSTGGGIVLLAALRYPANVISTVAMSPLPVPGVNATSHKNLLITIGKFDEAFSYQRILQLYRDATGDPTALEGPMKGNFVDGTARRFDYSQYNDHFTIIMDPSVIQQTVEWLSSSFEGTPITISSRDLLFLPRIGCIGLILMGGIIVLILIGIIGGQKIGANRKPVDLPEALKNASISNWILKIIGLNILLIPLSFGFFFSVLYTTGMSVVAFVLPLFDSYAISILILLYLESKKAKDQPFTLKQISKALLYDDHSWKEIVLGVILGVMLLLILQFSIGKNVTNMVPEISRIWEGIFLSLGFFTFFYAQELLTRTLLDIQSRQQSDVIETPISLFKKGIQCIQVSMLGFIFIIAPLIIGYIIFTNVITTKFIWMLVVLMTPLIFGIQFVNSLFYPYTKRILLPTIIFTIIITNALVAMSPYINCFA